MVQILFKTLLRLMLVLPFLALAGCGGKESAPSGAPQAFTVSPGDGQATLTWKEEPGLTYWVFVAAATSITPADYSKYPSARAIWPVRSGLAVTGLSNGVTYAFTINATKDGSPASPAAPSVAIVPRPAGGSWQVGNNAGTGDLKAVAYGNGAFMAVGKAGAIYRSFDAKDWTVLTSGTTADLNTVFFDGGKFMTLASDGKLLTSVDNTSWTATAVATGATTRLNSLVGGAGVYLAAGNGGTVMTSPPDLSAWTSQTTGTTRDLNRVLYQGGGFVAVGAGGTILSSVDGKVWKTQASGVSADLYGIAYGGGVFVVAGKGGTVLIGRNVFTDTPSWTVNPAPTTQDLYAISAYSQFVIVGAAGTVLTGTLPTTQTPISWTLASTGTGSTANDLTLASTAFVAVGVGGSNARAY